MTNRSGHTQCDPETAKGLKPDCANARSTTPRSILPWRPLAVRSLVFRSTGSILLPRLVFVEPMRVDDEYHRRGLASAMLTTGLDRLAKLGARRIKVGYSTDVAGALYESVGFRTTAATTWYAAASAESLSTAASRETLDEALNPGV